MSFTIEQDRWAQFSCCGVQLDRRCLGLLMEYTAFMLILTTVLIKIYLSKGCEEQNTWLAFLGTMVVWGTRFRQKFMPRRRRRNVV